MKQNDEMGKHIYVAGPYKSISTKATNQHIRNMSNACRFLLSYGFIPFFPLLYHFWDLIATKPEKEWLNLSSSWISRCHIFTYLWTDGISEGVNREREIASELGIPIYSYSNLQDLLQARKQIITLKKRVDNPICGAFIAQYGYKINPGK